MPTYLLADHQVSFYTDATAIIHFLKCLFFLTFYKVRKSFNDYFAIVLEVTKSTFLLEFLWCPLQPFSYAQRAQKFLPKMVPVLRVRINCTVGQKKKKKGKIFIYFNTNYRTEMKLALIIMDYCLLQFDALNSFLEVV